MANANRGWSMRSLPFWHSVSDTSSNNGPNTMQLCSWLQKTICSGQWMWICRHMADNYQSRVMQTVTHRGTLHGPIMMRWKMIMQSIKAVNPLFPFLLDCLCALSILLYTYKRFLNFPINSLLERSRRSFSGGTAAKASSIKMIYRT
jgi:hypothetical protein